MTVTVVFHVDETEKWEMALANVHNLLAGIEVESSQVEVLANGKAVEIFTSPDEKNLRRMKILSERGVKFPACRNSLKSHGIDEKALPGFFAVVPIGVLELTEKQLQGFAYIKL
jgi:hypothetical protein